MLQGQMGETYEGFINTRQDLIESIEIKTLGQVITYSKNCFIFFLFIVLPTNHQWMIEQMKNSKMKDYNKLAEKSSSYQTFSRENRTVWDLEGDKTFKERKHAFAATSEKIMKQYSHLEKKHNNVWYRSTETVMSENPHINWVSKKKWPLSEQLNLHMLNYQEV